MACLLVLVVAAVVLTGQPGKLTHATPTLPAEAFWSAALPGASMPDAIRELLRPGATGTDARPKQHHDADPPPLSFSYDADPPPDFGYSYDDVKSKHQDGDNSSLRNKAAAPSAEVLNRVAGARNDAAAATVFFLEDAVRVGGVLPIPIMIPRDTTANVAAPAASSPPLRLYTVRAVRAVDGCRFVVCRRERDREAGPDGDNNNNDDDEAVYGCRATTGHARAYVVGMVGERGETATAAVVCRTGDTSRWTNRARRAEFSLLGVKPGGAAAVCHAVVDAQVIPVKNDRSSSLLV